MDYVSRLCTDVHRLQHLYVYYIHTHTHTQMTHIYLSITILLSITTNYMYPLYRDREINELEAILNEKRSLNQRIKSNCIDATEFEKTSYIQLCM